MNTRQGTVTVIAESSEVALAWLKSRYVCVCVDSDGAVWRARDASHLVDEGADGVTLTFRTDGGV